MQSNNNFQKDGAKVYRNRRTGHNYKKAYKRTENNE
jgi:hypothetical protein